MEILDLRERGYVHHEALYIDKRGVVNYQLDWHGSTDCDKPWMNALTAVARYCPDAMTPCERCREYDNIICSRNLMLHTNKGGIVKE